MLKTSLILADLNRQVHYLNIHKERNYMNKLVYTKNRQPVTNSRIVAKSFGKRHTTVMRAIENSIKKVHKIAHPSKMFMKVLYSKDGQQFPMYLMNKDGFMLTVMSFTGTEATQWKMKFIGAFDYLIAHQPKPKYHLPKTYSSALRELADKVDENHKLAAKKHQMTPTYNYGRALSVHVSPTFTMKQTADQISNCFKDNIGRNKLMAILRYLDVLCKSKSARNMPRNYYIRHKWFANSYYKDHKAVNHSLLVTEKGVKGIISKIKGFLQKA